MQQLFTVKEYAAIKRISENTVWRRIASGEIKVERFGRAVRIIPNPTVSGFEYVDLPAYLQIQSQQKSVGDGKTKRKKS
jgi:excisionase family DNA binding protein